MNLQHERMLSLCEGLNLPFIAQAYAQASQEAVSREIPYSDYLEGLLKAEASGRQVRKQNIMTRLAGFPAIKTLEQFDYQVRRRGKKESKLGPLCGSKTSAYSRPRIRAGAAAINRTFIACSRSIS